MSEILIKSSGKYKCTHIVSTISFIIEVFKHYIKNFRIKCKALKNHYIIMRFKGWLKCFSLAREWNSYNFSCFYYKYWKSLNLCYIDLLKWLEIISLKKR